MVVGGIPQHGEQNGDPWAIPPDPFFSDVQIVDLSQQTRSCPNLTKYPIAMNAATGAIVSGHPMRPKLNLKDKGQMSKLD